MTFQSQGSSALVVIQPHLSFLGMVQNWRLLGNSADRPRASVCEVLFVICQATLKLTPLTTLKLTPFLYT